jgi:pheromone shutdown protein TraB
MKVCLKGSKKFYSELEINVIKQFIKFINTDIPLNKDVRIEFLDKKTGQMTTGSRMSHKIKVLAKERMLIDVLRTLVHEWVHEFQHQKLGLKDNDKIQDIGGPEENMANVLAGIIMKKFQKEYPEFKKVIYSGE